MSNAVKEQLWRLMKTLGKAEKRNFKLYATRAGADSGSKFIQLFDRLDRLDVPDDRLVRRELGLSAGQYSNLKRHLYQQLLTSLRLLQIGKEIDIELREQIDFGHILYGKGLYLDALRLLERTRARAVKHNRELLHLEVLEFQKLIEARHITLSRQVVDKLDLLVNESSARSHSVLTTSELININIQIHGRYIEFGHSRTPEDLEANELFWQQIQTANTRPAVNRDTFYQCINRFQATMWYHYIQLRFPQALDAALDAYNLFAVNSDMRIRDPDLYLRSLYYASVFSYLSGKIAGMDRHPTLAESFLGDDQVILNANTRHIGAVYTRLMRLNACFAHQDWSAAAALGRKTLADYRRGDFVPNSHRWGQFLYKFAAAAFMLGDYDGALDHLNDVLNTKLGILRQDLLLNTRLLQLLCHFELGHHTLVDYNLDNFLRQLRKGRAAAVVHRSAAAALRKLIKLVPDEHPAVYAELAAELAGVGHLPFERKALLYLDLRQWVARHRTVYPARSGSLPLA